MVRTVQSQRGRLRVIALVIVAAVLCSIGGLIWYRYDPNPLAGRQLYVPGDSQAARQLARQTVSVGQPTDSLKLLAAQPTAVWINDGSPEEVRLKAQSIAAAAHAQGTTPAVVIYGIPQRDCAQAGQTSVSTYVNWVAAIADGLKIADQPDFRAIVILEPDALAQLVASKDCLSSEQRQSRIEAIKSAIGLLVRNPQVMLYIDAGHPGWINDLQALIDVLRQVDADRTQGLAVNVSNFQDTPSSINYGLQLGDELGNLHVIIDTSRNGNGPYATKDEVSDPSWCNPPSRRIGHLPTVMTQVHRVDAYIWVKPPGESDGTCHAGDPPAGEWMGEKATQMVG